MPSMIIESCRNPLQIPSLGSSLSNVCVHAMPEFESPGPCHANLAVDERKLAGDGSTI